jgi:hypothetical protein
MEDSLALINFFVRNNHLASNEKLKLKKLIANIINPLFDKQSKTFDFDENQFKENCN